MVTKIKAIKIQKGLKYCRYKIAKYKRTYIKGLLQSTFSGVHIKLVTDRNSWSIKAAVDVCNVNCIIMVLL